MKKIKVLAFMLPALILASCGGESKIEKENTAAEPEVKVQTEPLLFDCETTSITTSEAWPDAKQVILSGREDGKTLLLVAPFFGEEIEKKGTIRANGVALLMEDVLDPGRMGYGAHNGGDCEEAKSVYLHELKYKWVWRNEHITENYDHTLVYYKFDSDEEVESDHVRLYFDEVAAHLIASGETVVLTGHTDADGTDEYNVELGLERAEAFKRSLVKRNVSEEQIKVDSKGRSMPIESNETEEGRQENRRVELRIIPGSTAE